MCVLQLYNHGTSHVTASRAYQLVTVYNERNESLPQNNERTNQYRMTLVPERDRRGPLIWLII